MIDGNLTVFLDIYGLFEAAEPDIYRADERRAATVDKARILLAEDTSFFRAVEKKYIEALGATVTAVKDGREAWRLLNETPDAFDMVVTDIEMPLMDGLELTRHIRASSRHAGLPIVALTSLGSNENREAGLAAGITIAAVPGEPAKRPYEIAMRCLEKGFYVRYGGDTIQLAPPFIIEKAEIDSLVNALGESLNATA